MQENKTFLDKIVLYTKFFGILVFIVVWIKFMLISHKVDNLVDNANWLVSNINGVVDSTKPVIEKSDKLVSILLKDAEIIDASVSKIAPILEKTNKLLDTTNKDMEIINWTLQSINGIFYRSNLSRPWNSLLFT